MKPHVVKPASCTKGVISFSGDKSIAHRSLFLSALASGKTIIKNFPTNQDCLSTLEALKKLGVRIKRKNPSTVVVFGKGLLGLKPSQSPIYIKESGTTLRLLLGVLAGQNFSTRIITGKSLAKRPMLRVTQPLRLMGAAINARGKTHNAKPEEYPPITIMGGNLKGITYKMPIASAQVKSAVLLAGLYARGETKVIELLPTRDHTERMMKLFRTGIKIKQNIISIKGNNKLISPGEIYVPGDISSASFFIVLALILPKSKITIKNVSLNPTRIGIIKVLKRMGADIKIIKPQGIKITGTEPIGSLIIKSSSLKGVVVRKKEIPFLIDELPILMVAGCFARGKTVLEGIGELRVKETDRISSMLKNLTKMGADIRVIKGARVEDIVIQGGEGLKGAVLQSFGDHRTAMSMIIAGLAAKGNTYIDDVACINKSFPGFLGMLKPVIS
ncbi:MAG: 3-phosphoshikimate 1-carboxyvinyltransferase [Candidatus Omnitrophica bacterium]|nr:3-phosphoshikimate 1-carboxyvinyltransferase [Candidatus Omnitrophota bacterium]